MRFGLAADWYEVRHINKRGEVVDRWRFSNKGEAHRLRDAIHAHYPTWRVTIIECREARNDR